MTRKVDRGLVVGVDGLTLPPHLVTSVTGIFGQREAGKSYTTHAIVEEVIEQALGQVVVFDPKGDWWGIRSSADGKGPGLPFVILGGERGDLPLAPNAGGLIADLVVDHRDHLLLDLSDFPTDADEHRFMHDFAVRLWRRKARDHRIVLLVIEEAATFVPQNPMGGIEPLMLGAMNKIAKMGRQRGIGQILADQRFADVNKKSLSQAAALLVGGLTSPTDRKAFDDYLKNNSTESARKAAASAVSSLPTGHLLAFAPKWGHTSTDPRVRPLRTFDSHRTPEPGEKVAEPRGRAHVDLGALSAAMESLVREQAESDPTALKRRVGRSVVETIEGSVAPLVQALEAWTAQRDAARAQPAAGVGKSQQSVLGQSNTPTPTPPRPARRHDAPSTADPNLTKTDRALLTALVLHGTLSNNKLALLTGYSPKSSSISVSLGKLRALGYVTESPTTATDAGHDALGPVDPLPAGPELLAWWQGRLSEPENRILNVVLAAYPNAVSNAEIAERTGYSPKSSSISVALGKLRRMGILDGSKVAADFAAAIEL